MLPKTLWFLSLLFASLAMVPSVAHFMEMFNKLQLSQAEYMTVQQIYRGWALAGIFVFGALFSTLALSILVRKDGWQFRFALLAFLCIAGTQLVFWTFTFPTNQLTENWTLVPDNWTSVRNQWEYSHAVSAGLNVLAMVALILAALVKTPGEAGER